MFRPKREEKPGFEIFVAMQQNRLDGPDCDGHIGHVAVQQAAGYPGRAGHDYDHERYD
jgi:hypothetical protein